MSTDVPSGYFYIKTGHGIYFYNNGGGSLTAKSSYSATDRYVWYIQKSSPSEYWIRSVYDSYYLYAIDGGSPSALSLKQMSSTSDSRHYFSLVKFSGSTYTSSWYGLSRDGNSYILGVGWGGSPYGCTESFIRQGYCGDIKIQFISAAINCVLSDWRFITNCDKSCGGGRRLRERNIITQAKYGGTACSRNLNESVACNLDPCPINCQYNWEETGCTKTCGGGKKHINSILLNRQHMVEPHVLH